MWGKQFNSKRTQLVGACVALCVATPFGSFAQDGLRATLDFTSRLETVSESGFTSPVREGERIVNGLDLEVSSENAARLLEFSAGGDLTYNFNEDVEDQTEIEDPRALLRYSLDSVQSAVDIVARYRRTDVDNANFFDAATGDIETGQGDRTNVSVNTDLIFGRESPTTFSLHHLYSRDTFSGETDGDTSDRTTNRVDTRLLFQVTPVAAVGLVGSYRDVDQDDADASDQTDQSIGIVTVYDLSNVLTLDAQLTYDEATSTDPTVEDTEGLGFSIDLDRELNNGSVSFGLSSEETVNGARQQAVIRRTMLLPRGTLNYSLGATRTGDSSLDPLLGLGLSYEVSPLSNVRINLTQESDIDDNDNETIRTRLDLDYTQVFNEISSITASAGFASQNAIDDVNDVDRSSINAALTYRREVGADWDMITGIEYTSSRRDDRSDRDRTTVFFGLEKTFDLRP